MKKTLQTYPNLIYVIYFIVLLIFIYLLHSTVADDVFFSNVSMNELSSFLNFRYHNWTSRLLIETLLVSFLHLPKICWCIITAFSVTITAWSISYIFTKHNLFTRIISILAVSLVPLSVMTEAGWYATTINYLWPLSCLLISVIPIKHAIKDMKDPIWANLIYIGSALFAGNQEQSCALLLGFYLFFFLYFLKKKKLKPIILIQVFIALISIVFIMTCPGNNLRIISETNLWYPSFASFSLIQKGILGVNSSFAKILINGSIPFVALSILIILIMKKKEKKFLYVSTLPLLLIGYVEFFDSTINKLFPNLFIISETIINFSKPIHEIHIFSIRNVLLIVISIMVFLSFTICLLRFFKRNRELGMLLSILLLAGFLSVIIMGFSPTVYASGMRPFTFFNYIIVILITTVICNMKEKKEAIIFLVILASLQVFNTILM